MTWLRVELGDADFLRLQEQARARGTTPDGLARELLHAGLGGSVAAAAGTHAVEALDRLAALAAKLPPSDALSAADEARRELDRRDAGAA